DQANVQIAEADNMVTGFEFGDADQLAYQGLADENPLALPHDLARAANPAHLMLGVIPGVLDAHRHRSGRARIVFRRRALPQRFMRPLLVVVPSKGIETSLLFGRIGCRWARGLLFERAMHSFVSPVFLRRGRMDEMRLDAELEPPGREPGQTARSG